MQGRFASQPGEVHRDPEPVRIDGDRYDSSQDNLARFVVYFGPYILWGSLGAVAGIIFLLSG